MGVPHHRRRHIIILLTAFTFIFTVATVPNFLAASERVVNRRRLVGPGSSPPTCRSKCGGCSPCVAVHVPIQPGLSTPQEYYPEAWRCKCGNSLYMP